MPTTDPSVPQTRGDRAGRTRHPQAILKGISTPWTEDYELDQDAFVRHTVRMLDHGYRHLYVFGTAGEGHAVGDAAYRRVVDVFADLMAPDDHHPQVGVITLSLDHAAERIAYALDRGVTTFQIVLPSWGVMSQDDKVRFFVALCRRFPEADFLHYNYPQARNMMAPEDYAVVIGEVPNLVATKTSTMDMAFIRGLMCQAGELQHFFLQGPFPYGCSYGECSLISSLAPVFPRTSMELFEAGQRGDLETAFRLQRRLMEVGSGLYAGVDKPHIDGAYDKLTSWLVDPAFPRRLLPPSESLSDEAAGIAREYYLTACSDLS